MPMTATELSKWKRLQALEHLPIGECVDALPFATHLTIVLVDPLGNLHDGEKVSINDLPPGTMELVRTLAADGKHVWKKTQVSPARLDGPIFEIMPRDPQAKGLEFQASVYYPTGGMHRLIAEAYLTIDAIFIADMMTVIFSPQLVAMGPEFDAFGEKLDSYIVTLQEKRFFSDHSLQDAIHKAAEWLRKEADPRLDEHRAQVMRDKELKGEWGKWE